MRDSTLSAVAPIKTRMLRMRSRARCGHHRRALLTLPRQGTTFRARLDSRNQNDGMRIMARRDGGGIRLITRRGTISRPAFRS